MIYKSGMEERAKSAEDCGGSDEDCWLEYKLPDEQPYFDKTNHVLRSVRHQPNHLRAVKKKELLRLQEISTLD